jgi:hypothetical protein
MRKDDPYHDKKVYHYAAKFANDGSVSALCFMRPHAIDMARGQSWTLLPKAVTCKRCRKHLRKNGML